MSNNYLAKMKPVLFMLFIILIAGCIFLLSLGSLEMLPDNAMVFVDINKKVYYSPPLMADDERDFLVVMPVKAAREKKFSPISKQQGEYFEAMEDDETVCGDFKRKILYLVPDEGAVLLYPRTKVELSGKGYVPDQKHANWGGFVNDIGMFSLVRQMLGLYKSRWTENGDWNW